MHKAKKAFTLIEVMIAVVIISTVIMALITMSGNNTHIFSTFKNKTEVNQYASFFISNPDYGYENEKVYLDDLLGEFDVESDLRRELKSTQVELNYKEVDRIDMSEFDESEQEEENLDEQGQEKEVASALIIEIGRTTLKTEDSSVSLLRIQVQ